MIVKDLEMEETFVTKMAQMLSRFNVRIPSGKMTSREPILGEKGIPSKI